MSSLSTERQSLFPFDEISQGCHLQLCPRSLEFTSLTTDEVCSIGLGQASKEKWPELILIAHEDDLDLLKSWRHGGRVVMVFSQINPAQEIYRTTIARLNQAGSSDPKVPAVLGDCRMWRFLKWKAACNEVRGCHPKCRSIRFLRNVLETRG